MVIHVGIAWSGSLINWSIVCYLFIELWVKRIWYCIDNKSLADAVTKE
jgi:hypothetical protein